jgi:hypothetical protein
VPVHIFVSLKLPSAGVGIFPEMLLMRVLDTLLILDATIFVEPLFMTDDMPLVASARHGKELLFQSRKFIALAPDFLKHDCVRKHNCQIGSTQRAKPIQRQFMEAFLRMPLPLNSVLAFTKFAIRNRTATFPLDSNLAYLLMTERHPDVMYQLIEDLRKDRAEASPPDEKMAACL